MAQRRSGRSDGARGVSTRVSRRDLLRGLSRSDHRFLGERVANLVLGRAKVDPFFGLARLKKAPAAGISSAESVS